MAIAAAVVSVVMWAGLPLLREHAELPAMLTATVVMMCAALVAALLAAGVAGRHARRDSVRRDLRYWAGGVAAIVGALYCYFAALDLGDPARVTVVTYVWPIGFIAAADVLEGRRANPAVFIGALLAFSGVVPLVSGDTTGVATPVSAYAFGVGAGACWIGFSLYLRRSGMASLPAFAAMFARAALAALVLHLLFEASVRLDVRALPAAAAIGVGPYGLAFITWGYALRHGPSGLLGVFNYFVPIISSMLLLTLGYSEPDSALLYASVSVTAGAILASVDWRPRFSRRRPAARRM